MGARSDGGARRARSGVLLVIALLAAVLAVGSGPAGAAKKTPPGDPPGTSGRIWSAETALSSRTSICRPESRPR